MCQTQFSHSRVSTYNKCPNQYKYCYIDKLRVVQAPDADDARIVGNTLHTGAEKGEKAMVDWYFKQFPIIDDLHVNESIKLVALLPKLGRFLLTLEGEFRHEYKIDQLDYVGFVDLIVTNPDGSVDIYDYKYSNNVKNYLDSEQLHLYKFYLEREGFKVNRIGFIFVPKTSIRQKKTEDLFQFRRRLTETLDGMEIKVEYIDYDFNKVKSYWESCKKAETATEFPKNPTRLCDWCDYENIVYGEMTQ